jgi:hypothetical protein
MAARDGDTAHRPLTDPPRPLPAGPERPERRGPPGGQLDQLAQILTRDQAGPLGQDPAHQQPSGLRSRDATAGPIWVVFATVVLVGCVVLAVQAFRRRRR